MILDVTTSDKDCVWELPEIPMVKSVSANAACLSVIYKCAGDWLNEATKEAMGEMISDVDTVVREAREVIKSARKQIPFQYKYIINPFNSWLQKLK